MSNFDDWLKGNLEDNLGSVVEAAISTVQTLDSRTLDNVCEELVQVVCRSKEMSEFKSKIFRHGSEVANQETEAFVVYDVIFCDSGAKGRNAVCASADGSPRVEKAEEYLPLSDRRGRSGQRSAGQRMQALDLLLKVPAGDIVNSANWPQLQQELCESLRDDNWTVFVQVLKVLARLSSSISFSPVREGFLSLLEGLTLYYLTRHLHQQLPSAFHGIKFDNAVHRRIILIAECVLQALNDVPEKWIRYGEKRTQEIVDNFVDLLSMHTHHHRTLTADQSKDILYPFHIFSVLDPEANWCTRVMHAAFGRSILLKSVMKSVSLIRFIVEEVIIWLNGQMKLSESVTPVYECGSNGNINGNTINLTVFIHCISLIRLFVSSDKGHLIFPVLTSIQEDAVSVYHLLLKLLEFLNKVSIEPKTIHSEKLVRVLENVCASLILSKGTRILHGSSVELIHMLVEGPARVDSHALHAHNINILSKISESPSAVRWMMGRPIRKTREGISRAFSELRMSLSSASSSGRESAALTNRAGCIARRIARATICAVRDRNMYTSDSTSTLSQLLALSEKLFSSPEGYLVLESCDGQLVSQAGHLFIYLRSMAYDPDPSLLAVQLSCESFLMDMTLTPMGFLAVCAVDGLLKCLISCYMESPITAKYKEPRLLHLLRLSTVLPDVKLHICRRSLIKHALSELWYTQDLKSDWMWHEAKQYFLSTVLSICSTPQVLAELLEQSEQEDSSSESTLVEQDEPLSLKELLDRGLRGSEEYPPCFQEVAFDVLHGLVHNVDFVFVLQEKFKLTDCLQTLLNDAVRRESYIGLTVQPSPRKDKIHTSDDIVRSCGHILNLMNQLKDVAGCNSLPWLKSPRSPRTHAHTSRPRVQTDLHRFLQDTRHGLHDTMWISHARRAYRTSCRSELKIPVLIDLLDQLLQSQPSLSIPEAPYRWPSSVLFPAHSPKDLQAIEITIRYGCQIKALNVNMINLHIEQLSLLLHQAKVFLGLQSSVHYFDWFSSSVFLMCSGNIDRSRSILQRVAMLPTGTFIWPLLSQDSIQIRTSINQHLQGLIAEYVPKAYNALLEAGVPWWFVVDQLAHQAFLPVMSVSQLPHMVALMALHSWEYNLYFHTSILAHVQPALLDLSLHYSIHSILMELKLDNFVIGDYLPFMDKLAKLNRPHLVRDRIATATL